MGELGSCNSTFVSNGIPVARSLWIEFPVAECMIARPDPLLIAINNDEFQDTYLFTRRYRGFS